MISTLANYRTGTRAWIQIYANRLRPCKVTEKQSDDPKFFHHGFVSIKTATKVPPFDGNKNRDKARNSTSIQQANLDGIFSTL